MPPSLAGARDPRDFDEYVIAQRYDAKILTALLAVGDCIYFDLGTPECAWQRPARSELPPVHWVSPVASCAHSDPGAACKLSVTNPARAAVHADGPSSTGTHGPAATRPGRDGSTTRQTRLRRRAFPGQLTKCGCLTSHTTGRPRRPRRGRADIARASQCRRRCRSLTAGRSADKAGPR